MMKKGSGDNGHEGRDRLELDIDRMVNEGLGGGQVREDNGLIGETTVDTMSGIASDQDDAPAQNDGEEPPADGS